MLICVLRVGFSDVSGISTTRLVVGVISAMVEKELGKRKFGFESLKSRLKLDLEEKGLLPGIVSCRSPAARSPRHLPPAAVTRQRARQWQRVIYIGSMLYRCPGAHGARDMEEAAPPRGSTVNIYNPLPAATPRQWAAGSGQRGSDGRPGKRCVCGKLIVGL